MNTVNEMLLTILEHEGGYVDDPVDNGGATNYGITQQTLSEWRNESVSKTDVKHLTKDEACEIYKERYLLKPKIDTINEILQPLVFDMCVNHGTGGGIKILQRTIKNMGYDCGVDGGIGPNTRKYINEAINDFGDTTVNNNIVNERIKFYNRIVENNKSQRKFLKGWINRATSFKI